MVGMGVPLSAARYFWYPKSIADGMGPPVCLSSSYIINRGVSSSTIISCVRTIEKAEEEKFRQGNLMVAIRKAYKDQAIDIDLAETLVMLR